MDSLTPMGWMAMVMLGGAVGCLLRHLLYIFIERKVQPNWPLGTLAVNITGSFVIGLLFGLHQVQVIGDYANVLLVGGVCGAYTTFSSFCADEIRLLREGKRLAALTVLILTIPGCIAMAGLGLALVRHFFG
ncbi:MAG: fluoride efflux transporter CrcB [Mariniblastus sp.]|nr:fluoride efflux transporter CrcB [Mariniblastus sp.]